MARDAAQVGRRRARTAILEWPPDDLEEDFLKEVLHAVCRTAEEAEETPEPALVRAHERGHVDERGGHERQSARRAAMGSSRPRAAGGQCGFPPMTFSSSLVFCSINGFDFASSIRRRRGSVLLLRTLNQ